MRTLQREIEPIALSVDDAEAMTGVSKWTWRRWAYSGKISSSKLGKRLLIPASEITRLMQEGSRPRLDQR